MDGSGATARMAEWVAQTRFEDLPRRVVEECKNQLLSVIASVHAGHFSEAGRIVSRAVKEWSNGKDATLMPSGERTAVGHAIFGNAALSMALDYDDYLFAGHTGHSAVLSALAVAEKIGVGGKHLLLAQALANEVEGRVGASVLIGPLNGQLWTFNHVVGSAIATCKLMELDKEQILGSIGIALLQPPYPLMPGFFGSDAKVLLASMAAPLGVQAAELAASGMRGAPDILENPQGFVSVFARTPLMGAYQGFGRIWLTDTLCYKIYPGCAYIDSFVDCILMMVRQNAIDARKVKAIHIAATPLTLAMDALSAPHLKGPNTLAQTLNFSVGYNAAVALIDKDLGPRQLTRERIKDPAVWELAAKVHLSQDDVMTQRMRDRSLLKVTTTPEGERYELDLSTADLTNFRMSLGARVRIEMEDGRSFDAEQEVPFGAAGRTYDERRKAVEDKFRRETRYTLRKEKMEKAIDVIHHLEDTSSSGVRELVRLCCSEKI